MEVFNLDRWPGKREEFFAGNYQAIEYARNAGYDIVFLGYMEEIRSDDTFTVQTKAIDTSNNVTLWSGKSVMYTRKRDLDKFLAEADLIKTRPEFFHFWERSEQLAACTVDEMLHGEVVPK